MYILLLLPVLWMSCRALSWVLRTSLYASLLSLALRDNKPYIWNMSTINHLYMYKIPSLSMGEDWTI